MHLFNRHTERVLKRVFYLLARSLNVPSSEIWARMKLGAWNSTWVSQVAGRGWSAWAILCCLSRRISRRVAGTWIVLPVWVTGIPSDDLTLTVPQHLPCIILLSQESTDWASLIWKSNMKILQCGDILIVDITRQWKILSHEIFYIQIGFRLARL